MPIYEYTCTSCQHNFELMQKINDKSISQCPKCFENTAIRIISPVGFQLKGSGWYATDFKNSDKPKPAAATEKKEAKTSETSTSKKAEE